MLLPNQWSLRPAGKQVGLGDFPINVAVHPGGRFAAVLHSGYSAHEILVVDIAEAAVVSRARVPVAFYGLEFARDGRQLFCSGAADEVVHVFAFQRGVLTNHHSIKLHDPKLRAVPAGLTVDAAAKRLFVANVWGDRVTRVDLSPQPQVVDILLGTNSGPLALAPVPSSTDPDDEAANKREEASLYQAGPNDSFPYTCLLDERRQRLYASLWAQAAVAVIDLKAGLPVARWPVEGHPCEMALADAPMMVAGRIVTTPQPVTAGDYVLVMTAVADTVKDAALTCYRRLERLTVPNSPMYRTDVGKRLAKQLPKIQAQGYATNLMYSQDR